MDIAFTLPPALVLGLIVSTILPLLVGLVTKTVTSPALKAILLALLAAVLGLATESLAALQAGRSYDLGVGLIAALGSFIVGVALHYGLWKPTGVSLTMQKISGPRHRSDDR